ncbi:methyl-accepting chemotaxis protein [Rhodoferax sp. WC2427]|uniref:methyl-accepting chemotaxis protein n=1 Tax=Rhodoferax sp. WC2427 TaxID=3234144 RepID=UPI00346562FE
MNNLKISTRMVLGFAVMGILIALVGGISTLSLNRLGKEFTLVVKDRYAKVAVLNDIADANSANVRALRDLILQDDAAKLAALYSELETNSKTINGYFETLKASVASPEGQAALDKTLEARTAYSASRNKVQDLVKAGDKAAATAALYNDLAPVQRRYQAALAEFTELQEKLMDTASASVESTLGTAEATVLGLVSFALLFAAVVGTWITRITTRPLAKAVEVARAVAAGDLTQTIDSRGTNETAQLFQALSDMQTQLAGIVQNVRQNADGVVTASAEIAQGNNDLSGRTEQQASALEETAASMEELSSTVKHNADNARQAKQLATSASTVAARGGQVVHQVVDTMKGINDSSKKIADIISVIDGIAFQTNILALNAAVEAARAGEQGRGFAVVASEVRNLAQRSAGAAKEIKGLIDASVTQVDQGTALVATAGSTMAEVVESIQRVSDIIAEVSAASTEQSAGVAQVGEAIIQMDQVTQQNAALVEESAAAANSLSHQAAELLQSVSVFKLNATNASTAQNPAKRAVKPPQIERRAPDRAKNVARPAFGKKPALAAPKAKEAQTTAVQARTGSDDWTSF